MMSCNKICSVLTCTITGYLKFKQKKHGICMRGLLLCFVLVSFFSPSISGIENVQNSFPKECALLIKSG